MLKKQEEIQLKLEGETLFLRVSSEKQNPTYEEKLKDLRRAKKYNQYQQVSSSKTSVCAASSAKLTSRSSNNKKWSHCCSAS